ncbi:MAG TPA: CehA/McbA family metallohydrolase, partial [Isosphaeraceae bacterium]|nr:CehA/McbA family metallohydrolase [Isosphaeraceae bacterium]
ELTGDSLSVELPEAGGVETKITDAQGGPIPCKIQFVGQGDTRSPDFGPDSGDFGVKNVYYSHNGHVVQKLEPGSYELIVSYGPEYDAVFKNINVKRGETTPVEAMLVRSVKTDGWISTDFHSHSTPSGDNTASQLGRVQNLLCEHIEFAPCTEHNRLSTYDPHLERLGATKLMATCVGMELTNKPLPLNHQNAFPLIIRPHTQNNGAPENDQDPEIQIERLKLWDNDSDKLVQSNHPDLGWMAHDRDGDHNPDAGFSRMFRLMDVIEVHPPHTIFDPPTSTRDGKTHNNRIVNWLQILNQGQRIPAVINTDAHYNFHGSGWRRNFVKSPTDDPSQIKTLDIVHACERGNVVVSTGPFLEVSLRTPDGTVAAPGDDLSSSTGEASLRVRVQCPNWFDIDRVQVFLNGRPEKSLNFTRKSTPDRFSNNTMKFDQEIPLRLVKDTHVLVAAIGEDSGLGPVMGPDHAKDHPVAVSNPIYVDVDGKGFQASGDTLGDLPVKSD